MLFVSMIIAIEVEDAEGRSKAAIPFFSPYVL